MNHTSGDLLDFFKMTLPLQLTLPDFIRWGPGYESMYYGINNTRPCIQKEHTELYKILKFRVNWANIEQDTAIRKLHNLQRNVRISGQVSGNPYIDLLVTSKF